MCIHEKNINKLKNYNQTIPEEQQVHLKLFNNGKIILEQHNLQWMNEALEAFVESICESIPSKQTQSLYNDSQKRFHEYATDAYRKFFNSLCTIIVSCDVTYETSQFIFDINGKNINQCLELYTKYSNIISQKVLKNIGTEIDKKHIDIFFAIPDFKRDVYVEPITNFRDKDGEHNLSIIHIHPLKFTNPSDTLRTITHEVAHHVGQTDNLRKKRSWLYFRCLVFYILYYNAINNRYTQEYNSKEIKSLKRLATVIVEHAEEYLHAHLYDFPLEENEDIAYEGADVIYGCVDYHYYTATSFRAITHYIDAVLNSVKEKVSLIEYIYNKLSENEISYLLKILRIDHSKSISDDNQKSFFDVYKSIKEMPDNSTNEFIASFTKNSLASNLFRSLRFYLFGTPEENQNQSTDNNYIVEEKIYRLFRECYADLFMLLVTSYSKKEADKSQVLADIYFTEMLVNNNDLTFTPGNKDALRFFVMYKYICSHSKHSENIKIHQRFKKVVTYERELDMFDKFHVECVLEYLKDAEAILKKFIMHDKYFINLKKIFKDFDEKKDAGILLEKLHKINESS